MRCKIPENDLVARLDNTFCQYDGHPYYIRVAGHVIHLQDIVTKKDVLFIEASDPKFDVSTIPLGYCQFDESTAVYVSRKPGRIFKQGVHIENVIFEAIFEKDYNNGQRWNMNCRQFKEMILGSYASFEATLEMLQNTLKPLQRAISRDVALVCNDSKPAIITVYFKNKEVGWIPPNLRTVIIPTSDFGWIISKHLGNFNWEVR